MKPSSSSAPAPQLLLPGLAIGLLAVLLSAGLHALGLLAPIDGALASLAPGRAAAGLRELPAAWLWPATVLATLALSLAMLALRSAWQRLVLWLATLLVMAAWAPVLILAAWDPAISPALVALLWCGICALIHGHHRPSPPATTAQGALS